MWYELRVVFSCFVVVCVFFILFLFVSFSASLIWSIRMSKSWRKFFIFGLFGDLFSSFGGVVFCVFSVAARIFVNAFLICVALSVFSIIFKLSLRVFILFSRLVVNDVELNINEEIVRIVFFLFIFYFLYCFIDDYVYSIGLRIASTFFGFYLFFVSM